MHRRKFLGTVAVGLGASALPVWLSRSFGLGGETCPATPEDPPPAPADPIRSECNANPGAPTKPKLVLVIPAENVTAQWDRGQAFGEYLNHGSDEQLGLFAAFDVVCRRVDQLPPSVQALVTGEPLMIVLDEHGPVPVRPLDGTLPPHPERSFGGDHEPTPFESFEDLENSIIAARTAILADLLRSALPHSALVLQATREHAALACDEAAAFLDLPNRLHTLTPAIVDRGAATTMLAIRRQTPDARARLWALLAAAVHARLTYHPVDGAPWARGGGCGVRVEGDDSPHGVACGMGHVPRKSVRFLKFFTARW